MPDKIINQIFKTYSVKDQTQKTDKKDGVVSKIRYMEAL